MTTQHDSNSTATRTLRFPDTIGRYDTDRWLIVLAPRDGGYQVIQQRSAKGTVTVPRDARVQLQFFPGRRADFSALSALAPGDLHLIDAQRTTFGDQDLEYVGALTDLRWLDLGNTELGDAGVQHLSSLTALEALNLKGTGITDEGLLHLRSMQKLRHLTLGVTAITDAGLAHLSSLSGLETLSLYATEVTDRGLEHLASLAGLAALYVEDTRVTTEGLTRLNQLLPRCEVHLHWGGDGTEESFDYQGRAEAAEQARLAIRRGRDQPDRGPYQPGSAEDRARLDRIETFRQAIHDAYPPGFWERMDLLRHRDGRALETAVRFLEADPWFFRSGYAKERILRRLRVVDLPEEYRPRVQHVILSAIRGRDRREFREYCRLARIVDSPPFREAVLALLDDSDAVVRRHAMWVLDGLRRPLDVESFRPEEVDPVELDFETLSAYLYYYGGTPAHYRAAAEKAIAAGVGDKALLALSIAPDLPLREQRVRYYRALRDSRWSACADNGRWVIVVRDIARRIIDGRIPDPYRGARLLYDQVVRAKSPDAVTWFRFLYAVEEQPDDPDPRSAILAEASRILQS